MDFRGYAAVFDAPWNDQLVEKMGYVESVARGAFRKALPASGNVPLLWQHERRDMLATTKSGNLRIREDGKGLLVEAKLPRNPLGEYVRSMIEAGDVRGMSYGIEVEAGANRITRENGRYHRRIANVKRLIDTTLTWEPAYEATTVELRTEAFTALPLQELVGGLGEQTDDTATVEIPPIRVSPYQGRMAELIIRELETGGFLP